MSNSDSGFVPKPHVASNSEEHDEQGSENILVSILDDIASMESDDPQHRSNADSKVHGSKLMEQLASYSHRLFQAHSSFVEAKIQEQGITLRQFELLFAVSELGTPSQRDLTDSIGMDRSTLSEVIKRLSSNGMLKQKQSQKDRRAHVISLTKNGRDILNNTLPIVMQANHEFFGILSGNELHALASIQSKLLRTDGSEVISRLNYSNSDLIHTVSDPTKESGNAAGTPAQDEAAPLKRLQRARTALDAGLITEADFEAEKNKYLDGTAN